MAEVDVIVVETVEVHVIEVITEGPQGPPGGGGGGVATHSVVSYSTLFNTDGTPKTPLVPGDLYLVSRYPTGSIDYSDYAVSAIAGGLDNAPYWATTAGYISGGVWFVTIPENGLVSISDANISPKEVGRNYQCGFSLNTYPEDTVVHVSMGGTELISFVVAEHPELMGVPAFSYFAATPEDDGISLSFESSTGGSLELSSIIGEKKEYDTYPNTEYPAVPETFICTATSASTIAPVVQSVQYPEHEIYWTPDCRGKMVRITDDNINSEPDFNVTQGIVTFRKNMAPGLFHNVQVAGDFTGRLYRRWNNGSTNYSDEKYTVSRPTLAVDLGDYIDRPMFIQPTNVSSVFIGHHDGYAPGVAYEPNMVFYQEACKIMLPSRSELCTVGKRAYQIHAMECSSITTSQGCSNMTSLLAGVTVDVVGKIDGLVNAGSVFGVGDIIGKTHIYSQMDAASDIGPFSGNIDACTILPGTTSLPSGDLTSRVFGPGGEFVAGGGGGGSSAMPLGDPGAVVVPTYFYTVTGTSPDMVTEIFIKYPSGASTLVDTDIS